MTRRQRKNKARRDKQREEEGKLEKENERMKRRLAEMAERGGRREKSSRGGR